MITEGEAKALMAHSLIDEQLKTVNQTLLFVQFFNIWYGEA